MYVFFVFALPTRAGAVFGGGAQDSLSRAVPTTANKLRPRATCERASTSVVRRPREVASSWDVTVHSPSSLRARGPGQTKRYGPWHVTKCPQAHSRLLCNLLNGWCQPRSHFAPRSWPSANIERKSCTTCLGPFVLRKPACARTLICQRHQSQFEGASACACDLRWPEYRFDA